MPGKNNGEIESKKLLYLKWMEEYMQSIRGGDGFVSQDSKMIYEDLEESLRELTTLTEKYYTLDEEGEYPVVKEEDYDKLIKGYQNVSRKISNYRKVAEAAIKNPPQGSNTQEYLGNKQMEEARLLTFSMLEPLIALDVDTLITSKTQGALDMPLGEMLAEGRVREVEYTGDVKTVGSSMSSRLSVTVENSKGDKVPGFFTPQSFVNTGHKEFSEECVTKHAKGNDLWAGAFRKFFKATYETKNQKQVGMVRVFAHRRAENMVDFTDYVKAMMKNVRLTSKEKALLKDPRFVSACASYIEDVANRELTTLTYNLRGVKKGNIDQRNSAMTAVSELLGFPGAVAPSYSVKLKVNGKEMQGTFMGHAKGTDINLIDPKSPMNTEMDYESIDNPDFLKSVSNLQVLDFICGNTDRHRLNQFYQLDDSKPPKIIGVQGIDNDLSFGTTTTEHTNFPLKLEEMGFITESAANAIMTMTPDVLTTVLQGYDLEKEHIEAACQRLSQLQQSVVEGKSYYADMDIDTFHRGHLKVVKDADLPKITMFGSLADLGEANHFARNRKLFESVAVEAADRQSEERTKAFKALRENTGDIKATFLELESADKGFFIGSASYGNTLIQMKDLMRTRSMVLESKNPEAIQEYWKKLNDIEGYVDEYLNSKQGMKLAPGRATRRFDVMTATKEIVAREKEAARQFLKGAAEKNKATQMKNERAVVIRNSKEFLRNRSVLRQTMRMQWDEKRRSIYQSLDTDSRKSLDKNIDYSIVAMSENAANRLAEMNTNGKKSAEFLAEKVRHFATLAVEQLWENEYYSGQKGPIRNTIPDKKTLMTQINQLVANKQFAENAGKITITSALISMDKLVPLARPILTQNLEALKNKVQEGPKVQGPEKTAEKQLDAPKVDGPAVGGP